MNLYSETGIGNLIFEQAAKIRALEHANGQRERWDEGVVCMEWALSRVADRNVEAIPLMAVMQMLGDVVVFANTGRKAEWLVKTMEEIR